MKRTELNDLMDLARRRVLNPDEQSRLDSLLRSDPSGWPERDEELALSRLLQQLPDAPLSSNFTSRVMQAIDRAESIVGSRPASSLAFWRRWVARLAWTTAAVAIGGFSWMQYQHWQRAETARSLRVITEVAAVPSVDVLRDFEAIQSFARVPPVMDVEGDLELLNALQ